MRSPLLTLLLLAAALPAAGQLSVTRVQEVAAHPYGLHRVQAEDLDGDGDLDLILQDQWEAAMIVWCENRGDGTFSPPIRLQVHPRDWERAPAIFADLDGDGRRDIYLWKLKLTNLGNGDFTAAAPIPGAVWPTFDNYSEDKPFGETLAVIPAGDVTRDRLLVEKDRSLYLYSIDEADEHHMTPLRSTGGSPLLDPEDWSREASNFRPLDLDEDGDFDLVEETDDHTHIHRNLGNDVFAEAEILTNPYRSDLTPEIFQVEGAPLPSVAIPLSLSEPWKTTIAIYEQSIAGNDLVEIAIHSEVRLEAEGTLAAMVAVDDPGSTELWIRVLRPEPLFRDWILCYQRQADGQWEQTVELQMPKKGWGELILMRLHADGPPGLLCRFGGASSTTSEADASVAWASLESLRIETPEWRTLAGPFTDFGEIHLLDLDLDGALDLITPEKRPTLNGSRSGRAHLIHDVMGRRETMTVNSDPTPSYSGLWPGNRLVVGDADGDLFPDIAISDGSASAMHLLRNQGGRRFSEPELLASLTPAENEPYPHIIPLRLDSGGLRFFQGGQLFTKPTESASEPTFLHDFGTPGEVAFIDMDDDGDLDVVAAPCPLGDVTGWGEVGAGSTIVGWRFLASSLAKRMPNNENVVELGWISNSSPPSLETVREGQAGLNSIPLPEALPQEAIWPPLDLDCDGDLDILELRIPPAGEWFGIIGPRNLYWSENRGSRWQSHAESLLRTFHLFNPVHASAHIISRSNLTTILYSNGHGEVRLLDFAALNASGTFGEILASHGLTGASAGPLADPDGDGLTNLEEVLQGSSPVDATPGLFHIPVARLDANGWNFTTSLPLQDSGIVASAETSADLQNWTPLASPPVPDTASDGTFRYRIEDPEAGAARRFVRIRFAWSSHDD